MVSIGELGNTWRRSYPCCTKTRDARADYCYFHFMSASNAVEGEVEKEEVLGVASLLDRALA